MKPCRKREYVQGCESKRKRVSKTGLERVSKTGIVWSGDDDKHRHPRRTHIERPERIIEILRYLRACGIIEQCLTIETPEFDTSDRNESTAVDQSLEERLITVHSPYYLSRFAPQRMRRLEKRGGIEALVEEAGNFVFEKISTNRVNVIELSPLV